MNCLKILIGTIIGLISGSLFQLIVLASDIEPSRMLMNQVSEQEKKVRNELFPKNSTKTKMKNRFLILLKRDSIVTSPNQVGEIKKQWMNLTEEGLQQLSKDQVLDITALNLKKYWILGALAVDLNESEFSQFITNSIVDKIIPLGRKANLTIDESIEFYYENQAVQNFNQYTYGLEKIQIPKVSTDRPEVTGRGVRVGVIDTGIDPKHPDFKGRILGFKNFISPHLKEPLDDHGHGTHVAGTIAAQTLQGIRVGVAPEAELLIAKAFSGRGSSTDEGLIAAFQWLADPDGDPNTDDHAQVINNSWNLDDSSFSNKTPDEEIFCKLIDQFHLLGTTVIFAAGNDGSRSSSVKLPGACPQSLTVGATDSSDGVTSFSSRGPVKWKDESFIKPDIVAPGRDIRSADRGTGYRTRSGTSMAAPHVAGVVALVYQVELQFSPAKIQDVLLSSARVLRTPTPNNDSGYGIVQAFSALEYVQEVKRSSELEFGKIIGRNDLLDVEENGRNLPENLRTYINAIGWTNYGCTVNHIGGGYAISAGHCFEAKETLTYDKSCRFVKVKWGFLKSKSPTMSSQCENIVVMLKDSENDFAILKLKETPPSFVPLEFSPVDLDQDVDISILSHPSGRPLMWSQTCQLQDIEDFKIPKHLLKYECDTEGGSSGAFLLHSETGRAIGIHKGGYDHLNYGTSLFTSKLQEELRKLNFY